MLLTPSWSPYFHGSPSQEALLIPVLTRLWSGMERSLSLLQDVLLPWKCGWPLKTKQGQEAQSVCSSPAPPCCSERHSYAALNQGDWMRKKCGPGSIVKKTKLSPSAMLELHDQGKSSSTFFFFFCRLNSLICDHGTIQEALGAFLILLDLRKFRSFLCSFYFSFFLFLKEESAFIFHRTPLSCWPNTFLSPFLLSGKPK